MTTRKRKDAVLGGLGLYAFWAYDARGAFGRYEPVLGAPVVCITKAGLVQPEGYGGWAYKPILLVPRDEGERIHAELRKIFAPFRRAHDALVAEYRERACAVAPQLKEWL